MSELIEVWKRRLLGTIHRDTCTQRVLRRRAQNYTNIKTIEDAQWSLRDEEQRERQSVRSDMWRIKARIIEEVNGEREHERRLLDITWEDNERFADLRKLQALRRQGTEARQQGLHLQ